VRGRAAPGEHWHDQELAGGQLGAAAVVLGLHLGDAGGQRLGQGRGDRRVVAARGHDDLVGGDVAGARGQVVGASLVARQAGDLDALETGG
jgi:hypothetical protein